MTGWAPQTAQVIDNGFGGSRGGDTINGVVIHHVAGTNGLMYVANANSRNSHPTYHIDRNGKVTGIVHPDRRPYSTAGRPDSEAVTFEIDNSAVGGNWPISDASLNALIDVIVWHASQSPRKGKGFARNIPGQYQSQFFIAWHQQYVATACPGPYIISMLDYIVAECIKRSAPKPPPVDPNVDVEVGALVGVKNAFSVFSTAANARAGSPVKATYPAGNYYVYKIDKNDVVNLSKTQGKPGGWVKIASVGLVEPTPVIWKVVFDDTPDDDTSDYSRVDVQDGEKVFPPLEEPTREGYIFKGWYDGEMPYDFSKPVKGLLTLTALWEAEPAPEPVVYDVVFDYLGDGSKVEHVAVEEGQTVGAKQPEVVEGYDFLGWFNGDSLYDFGAPVLSDLTLVAKYQKQPEPEEPETPGWFKRFLEAIVEAIKKFLGISSA